MSALRLVLLSVICVLAAGRFLQPDFDEEKPLGDAMDQYIASAGSGDNVPMVKNDRSAPKPSSVDEDPLAAAAAAMDSEASVKPEKTSDSDSAPAFEMPASQPAADAAPKEPDTQPISAADMSQTDASSSTDSSSAQEAPQTNQVIDIHLDSELQESLMQKGKKAPKVLLQKGGKRMQPNAKENAVEAAVAKEKSYDVYIHDGFGEQEKEDKKEEKEINSKKELKA